MSLLELMLVVGFVMVGYRIIRGVMGPGIDLIEEGRKRAERLGQGLQQPTVQRPPGPRPAPSRVSTRPASRDTTASRATARTTPSRATPAPARRPARVQPSDSLDEWYLVLDVSPDADRREIQEAIKLRLSRARADRDNEGVQRVMRAAGTALSRWRRAGSR